MYRRKTIVTEMPHDEMPDVLDSLLSELLGGQRPPDLADRVLRALQNGKLEAPSAQSSVLGPVTDDLLAAESTLAEFAPAQPAPTQFASRQSAGSETAFPESAFPESVKAEPLAKEGTGLKPSVVHPGQFDFVVGQNGGMPGRDCIPKAANSWTMSDAKVDGRTERVAKVGRRPTHWVSWMVTASCVLLLGTLLGVGWLWQAGYLAGHWSDRSVLQSRNEQPPHEPGDVIVKQDSPLLQKSGAGDSRRTMADRRVAGPAEHQQGSAPVTTSGGSVGESLAAPFGGGRTTEDVELHNRVPGTVGAPAIRPDARRSGDVVAWQDDVIVERIDKAIEDRLREVRLVAAGPATEAEFCRRAFVRLLGRIPTVDELQAFILDTRPHKRRYLVQDIVFGETYREEFASYWAQFLANTLIGRTAGTRPTDLADRQVFVEFLRDVLLQDRPWNEVVRQFVEASGSNRPGDDDFQPAVNFLLAYHSPDATVETVAIARLFLGRRYQCAQCHNHPFAEDLSQNQFWQLNAFLRQMRAERRDGRVYLVDRDAASDVVFYEELNGVQRAVFPVLPDGTEVPTSGKIAQGRRRQWLADWLAASPHLSRATVNRLWAYFFGYGFTRPVDELAPGNPVSHPEVLAVLAEQFQAHQFSLRRLIGWIAQTEAFGRSSRISEDNIADMPEHGEMPWFSRYYARQMHPEAVYNSLQLVAQARRSLGAQTDHLQFLGQFAQRMETDDAEEINTFTGDIRQMLLLMTGNPMRRAVSTEEGAVLRHVMESKMSNQDKITHLFLAAVARPPTDRELKLGMDMIARNTPEVALQDIWWALLNSSEFLLDH
jgi:hypothetical protein